MNKLFQPFNCNDLLATPQSEASYYTSFFHIMFIPRRKLRILPQFQISLIIYRPKKHYSKNFVKSSVIFFCLIQEFKRHLFLLYEMKMFTTVRCFYILNRKTSVNIKKTIGNKPLNQIF